MKKLSLEMLRLTSDEVLGRSQMKKITGGYGHTHYCHCIASVGAWSGSYTTQAQMQAAFQQFCASGLGVCQ